MLLSPPKPLKQTAPTLTATSRTDGTLYVVTGATRTGKTTWVAQRVKNARQLLVWDSADEWGHSYRCERLTSVAALAGAVAPGARDRRLAFVAPVTAANFEYFCRLAWVYLRSRPGVTVIVEELSDVTSPGKAPVYWGEIVRKGLRYGPSIYALTQRPSESDKTVIGNASVLHVHQMARIDDCRYMARELRVADAIVEHLLPFHWIERDRRSKALTNGRIVAHKH